MSQIKLKHSGGNSVIIAAPDSNPASDRTLKLPSNADGTVLTTTNPKSGNIIQVVSTTKTDAFSTTSTSYTDITGLSINITPSSSSNKVLVDFVIACGNNASTQNRFQLVRQVSSSDTVINPSAMDSSTAMFAVEAEDNNNNYSRAQVIYRFLDSPSTTSQVNYRLRTLMFSSSYTQYVNRAAFSTNTIGSSTLTAQEVAA